MPKGALNKDKKTNQYIQRVKEVKKEFTRAANELGYTVVRFIGEKPGSHNDRMKVILVSKESGDHCAVILDSAGNVIKAVKDSPAPIRRLRKQMYAVRENRSPHS